MNVLDAKQWANPRIGEIVLGALDAPTPERVCCHYRAGSMSARELWEALKTKGFLGDNYYDVCLSKDRVWLEVSLDLRKKGASACSFGFLENRIEEVCGPAGYWSRWMGGEGPGVHRRPYQPERDD